MLASSPTTLFRAGYSPRIFPSSTSALATPHTVRVLPRGFPLAPRTLDGRCRVGVVLLDVYPVGLRDGAVVRVAEDRDVVGGDVGAALPAEVGLADVLGGEEGGAALPHASAGDVGVVDLRASRGLLHHLLLHLVGDIATAVEVAPERRRRVVALRVVGEPPVQVRDTGDQRGRALAGLPVDGDLEAVLVVGDVTDAELTHLPAAGAEVPRDRNHRGVPRVSAVLEHGVDVVVPPEHLRRVRAGLEAPREGGLDLALLDGQLVPEGALSKDPDGDTVVLVGVRRFADVVLVVDPVDNRLTGVGVLASVNEVDRGLLARDCRVPPV